MNWQSHMASAPSFPLWRRKRRRWIGAADAWLLLGLLLVLRFPQRLAERLPREVALKADRQLEPLLVAKRENGNNNDRTEDEEAAAAEGNFVGLDPEEEEEQTSSRPSRNESPSQLFMDPTFQRPRQQLFYLSDEGPPTQAFISSKSWDDYQRFKEETCRKDGAEESLAEQSLNSTESGYFHWEQNEFHRQLRGRLLPQTRGGSFRSLVGSQLLHRLDPRLFASEPRTLCKAKRHISEADERQKMAKEEQHMFEDFLINKVLPVDMFAPRRSANTNATTAGGRRV